MSLANDAIDNFAMHIGEAEITSGVLVGQFLVIEPKQMQNRRVKIVHVHLVQHRFVPKLIGSPVGVASFRPATSQPNGETTTLPLVEAPGAMACGVGNQFQHLSRTR